jgi:hypothetical protein
MPWTDFSPLEREACHVCKTGSWLDSAHKLDEAIRIWRDTVLPSVQQQVERIGDRPAADGLPTRENSRRSTPWMSVTVPTVECDPPPSRLRFWLQPVETALCVHRGFHETGLSQHSQVL